MAQKKQPAFGFKKGFYRRAFRELAPQLQKKGDEIANAVSGEADAKLKTDANGRPVVLIALKHPNGAAIEAKEGRLEKAARANGATIHRYQNGGEK